MDFVYADNFAKYKDDFKWSHEYNEKGESFAYTDLNLNSASIRMEPTSLTDTESMGAYHYAFVNTEIVVRSVNPQQDGGDPDDEVGTGDPYWYKGYTSESKAYTVYASIIGEGGRKIYTNVRIDAFLSPFLYPVEFGTNDATDLTSANSPVGKTFHVTGYVSYYFGKYQIQVPNNNPGYNYFYKVTA